MWTKKHKYLLNGVLLFLLFSMLTSITAIRADNTLYPLNNYFAFGENGTITKGLSNESYTLENGFRVHEILSDQDAYKFRVIFPVPDKPFEILSLRVRMIFTENITEVIRWGYARNVSVSVYPFELATIDGTNNSAQVLDALDLYHGKEVQFHFNTTVFEELEFFELAFSSWNATPNLRAVQFEQINFHMPPENIFSETAFLVMLSSAGLFGVSIASPTRFRSVFLILLALMLLLVPLTVVTQVRNILDSLPQEEKGVTRFTFFGRVYERRDLGNGYFSLRMVKDLAKAFELQALSGTGSTVVYPMIENETEQYDEELLVTNPYQDGESSTTIDKTQQPTGGRKLIPNFLIGDMSGNPLWWNTSYAYVKQVTINAGTALGTNYTVQADLATSALVSASKMRADAKDLRVVYYNTSAPAGWFEIDRVVLNNNSVKTSVFFRLQKAISASSSDSNYAIYYGATNPGIPPSNTSKIFLDSDDFSSGNLNDYNPTTGWTASTDSTKPTNIGWWSNTDIAGHTGTTWSDLNRPGILTDDHQILVLQRVANSATQSAIALRSSAGSDWTYLAHSNSDLEIIHYNLTTHTLATDPGGFSTSTWYFYKFEIVGSSTLQGKNWVAGNNEPLSWTLSTTDGGIPSSGYLVFTASYINMYVGMWALMEAVVNPPDVTVDLEETEIPEIIEVTVTNADAGVIHSKRQYYDFQVGITEGYNKTDIVQLNFTVNSFEYSVVYNSRMDTFSEFSDNGDHYTLDIGGSYISRTGKNLDVFFKIQTDWEFPNGVNIPLNAFVNDTLSNSTSANSATNYAFNHDIQVSPFTVDDNHINPTYPSNLNFDGSVNYTGTQIPVSDSEVDEVAIIKDVGNTDVSVGVTNATASSFSIEVDSETAVGIYTYYPYVKYAGNSLTWNGTSTTTLDVNVDRVEITGILISDETFEDSGTGRYWEDADGAGDAFTITIIAEWDYTGDPYQGEVKAGYAGNNETYGTTFGLIINDVEEDPAIGNIITRDDITVGFAVTGPNNDYGTEVFITASLPKIGWDNAAPTINHLPSATNESSDYLYYDGSSAEGYYSDNMGLNPVIFNVGGSASDVGSGLKSIIDKHPSAPNFGGNPIGSGLSSWSFNYSIDQTNSSSGDVTITYSVKDNVDNENSVTFTFLIDNNPPTQGLLTLNISPDTDTSGDGIDPDTGYDDDGDVDVVPVSSPLDSGSGLPTLRYLYRTDDGSYGTTWLSAGTTLTSVSEGSRTIYILVRDNVGNNASDLTSVGPLIVDTTPPLGFTSIIYEIANGQYLYVFNETLIYFNGAENNLWFDIEINTTDGVEDNFWKVRFPDVFNDGSEEDSTAPYRRSTDYDIDSMDEGTIINISIIDRAGNRQLVNVTAKEDSTAPFLISIFADLDTSDNTGDDYIPSGPYSYTEAFYDDQTFTADLDYQETQSGIATLQIRSNSGSYGVSTISGIDVPCTLTADANNTIWYKLVDNVGNTLELASEVNVYFSTAQPIDFDIDVIGAEAWTLAAPNFIFISNPNDITSGTLYVNTGQSDTWTFSVDADGDADWRGGGAWYVLFEAGWDASEVNDSSSAPYQSAPYSTTGTQKPDLQVDIVNRCGVNTSITIATTVDITAPTFGYLTLDDDLTDKNSDGYFPEPGWYDDVSQNITVDFSGVSDSQTNVQNYQIKITVGGTYGPADADGIDVEAPYGSDGTNLPIYYRIHDSVGNELTGNSGFVNIDDTEPSGCTPTIHESASDIYAESGIILWISDSFPTAQTFYITGTFGSEDNPYGVAYEVVEASGGGTNTTPPYTSNNYSVDNAWKEGGAHDIDVFFFDWAGNVEYVMIDTIEDKNAPSLTSITADLDFTDNNGDGYFPSLLAYGGYDAFYDESSFTADIIHNNDGAESGIEIVQIKSASGSYGASIISGIDVPCTLIADTDNIIWYRLVDKVNNTIEASAGINIYYSSNPPINFDIDVNGAEAWTESTPNYVYISDPTDITSGTLYINTGQSDTWTFSVDADGAADWQGGGAWYVIFEAGWGLSSNYNDSIAPYNSDDGGTSYSTLGTADGDLWIDIVNRCGIRTRITISTTEDIDTPSLTSITADRDTDDDTGDGFIPSAPFGFTEAFYDESSFTADIEHNDDGSGAGVALVQIKSNSGSYGTSIISGINVPCTLTADANNTIWYKFVDNVGNTLELPSDVNVYYGVTPPTSFDIDVNGADAWTPASPNYVFIADSTDITSGTLLINTGETGNWNFIVDADGPADWYGGGAWFVFFEAGWGAGSDNDTSPGPYQSLSYSSLSGAEPDLRIDIVNRCGINTTIIITTTEDVTPPTMDSITVRGNDSAPLEDWDQDGKGFSITPSTISDTGSGNNGYLVNSSYSPILYHTFEYVFPGFTYPDDVGTTGPYTFYAFPIDKVGNNGTIRSDIGNVDESPPTAISTQFTNSGEGYYAPNWFDQGSITDAFYEITFDEDEVYSISVVVSGGIIATGAGEGQGSPFTSTLTIGGKTDGTYAIAVTIIDKAGHTTTTYTGQDEIKLDDTGPSTTINPNFIFETPDSDYLYWDLMNNKMWYGDNMSSAQSFTIGVDASDSGVGLKNATVSDQFGGTNAQRTDTTNVSVSPTYDVPVVNVTYTSDFIGNLIITVYDLLGNSNSTTLSIDRDTIGPSGFSLFLIADFDSNNDGIDPNTNYDDDLTINFTINGAASDGTGSGLPTNYYGFSLDGGIYEWQSISTKEYTGVTEINHTVTLRARDNVGNNETVFEVWVWVDTGSPEKFDLDWGRASGIGDGFFAFYNDTEETIYFRPDKDDYFNVTVYDNGTSTICPSDFWNITWDLNSVFESRINETITGLNASKNFNYYNALEGFFVIRLLANNGNYQEWNITAKETPDDVTIIITSVIAEAPYLYYDGTSSYGYYSNKMGSNLVSFTISGNANSTVDMKYVNDTTRFGNNPNNNTLSGTSDSWSFTYLIDENDGPANGTFVVTFIAYNVGGLNGTVTFEFRYDFTPPSISLNALFTYEGSPFLYYDGSSAFGFYSNNMVGTSTPFYVGGYVSDSGAGLTTVTDNTNFGGNPLNVGTAPVWQFSYGITASDSSYGTVLVTYNATDNVGNSNTGLTFEFIEDNTNPLITLKSSATNESSPYLYYDGSSTYGYYSENMGGTPTTFNVGGNTSDGTGSDLYTLTDDTSFGEDPSPGGSLWNWSFSYNITAANSGYGTFNINYNASDNVGNFALLSFEFRLDTTIPIISTPLVENPNNSPYIYIEGTYFFFSDNMASSGVPIKISGTTNDAESGYLEVTYTSHFGDSPPANDTPSWSATYYIHGTDPEQTGPETDIIITAIDNVGNQNATTVTFLKDNYIPVVSLSSIYESSPYLYYNGSVLFYSNQSSVQRTFIITILAQETHANLDTGLNYTTFPNIFGTDGGDNTTGGDSHQRYWSWSYSFISSNQQGPFTIKVYDLVGNEGSANLMIIKDDQPPSVSIEKVIETSWLLYYVGGTLYYSNDQSMAAPFTLNVSVTDGVGESGRASANGSLAFGETPSDDTYLNGYIITYIINQDETGGGSIVVKGFDRVGNNATASISLILDNEGPFDLDIEGILGYDLSEFLHYVGTINGTLYYSNWNPSMSEQFTIQVSGSYSDVPIVNVTGEADLGEIIEVLNSSVTPYYNLIYTVDPGDIASSGKIDIHFYDLVGNNASISLTTTLDNDGPVSIEILPPVLETSDFLYYDIAREILFYSNDDPMIDHSFTFHINATDFGAGLNNATGEDDFGDTGVGTSDYANKYYELTYTISTNENASNDIVVITIFDMCGNNNTFDFNTRIDNSGPQDVKITEINDYGSKYIYLYNDSGSLTLYVSNRSSVDHKFTITIDYNEPTNEVGFNRTISGLYFGESYVTTFNFVTYFLNTTDNVENGTLTIWAYDRVNNSNFVNLQIYGDLTNPSLLNDKYDFDDHGSDYLHNDSTTFYFSDIMPTTQLITIYGTGTDGLGGSGVDRVTYESAFGSSPSTDLGASWSADYGIDSTDPESGTTGSITITITDHVNNNYSFFVQYVADNEAPSGLGINDIIEELLAEYLHYVGATTTLYYSNVSPERGSRKFKVKVDSTDTGGAGLRNASFPDIGIGFSAGGYNTSHVSGQWEFSYLIDNPGIATYNTSVTITVYDWVANSNTISFTLFRDISPPYDISFTALEESSDFLYYNPTTQKFYYSYLNPQMGQEQFNLTISAKDSQSGLFSANGSLLADDFNEKNSTTKLSSGNSAFGTFSLYYNVSFGETSGTDLIVTIFDSVGNSDVFTLITVDDNQGPVSLEILTVIESSPFLYYNPGLPAFYYSNDQSMTTSFTIHVNGTDTKVGLYNATGEANEFNSTTVGNTSYITYFELTYNIEGDGTTNDGLLTIRLFDHVGNQNNINLTCIEDNIAPTQPNIIAIQESSNYLYFNDSTGILYYSNFKTGMNEKFTILFTTDEDGSGRFLANSSSDFGSEIPENTTYSGVYELSYFVGKGEDAGPDNLININVYDNCGNVNFITLSCTLDLTPPDVPTIEGIIESSEFLHYNTTYFFYSKSIESMSEVFAINLTTSDTGAGLYRAVGSADFGDSPPEDLDYTNSYLLSYAVNFGDDAGADNNVTIIIFDLVGNNDTISLQCINDYTGPEFTEIIDVIVSNAQFLYYDGSTETFYYSNDQSMSESFIVQINATDSESGVRFVNASEFGSTVTNGTYDPIKGYQLSFLVNQNENATSFTITAWDEVGNPTIIPLITFKDNTPPQDLQILTVIELSDFLYYNSSSKELYFSNDQIMNEDFKIHVSGTYTGAALKNATGENEFLDPNVGNTTYTTYYELTYNIELNDPISDGKITIWLYDLVGNRNSTTLTCRIDNDAPDLAITSPLPKTWYNIAGGVYSFGGTVIDLGLFNSGVDNDSFAYSQFNETLPVVVNKSFTVLLGVGTWLEHEDEIASIDDDNVTLTVYVWDRCNNTNSASIEIWHDDTPPTITYTDPSIGGDTPFYIPADEITTTFDINFGITGGQSFYSGLIKAEYRTDDGTGWVTIFDNTSSPLTSDYTTDWQILDWFNSLFNGNNTIDLRVTDEAGNTRTHLYVSNVSGFNFRYDSQGPVIVDIFVKGNEVGISNPFIYDWYGSNFNLSFTFNSSSKIDFIYIYSDINSTIQKFENGIGLTWQKDSPVPDLHFAPNQTVSYNIGDTGNRSIFVRALNNAGLNSSWIEVKLFVDEDDPTLSIQSLTEGSTWNWTIYADIVNSTFAKLYYSDLMGSNPADFILTVNAADVGSGMANGYVRFEQFYLIPEQDDTYIGVFNVNDSIIDGSWVNVTAVDASNRSATFSLVQVILDTTAPDSVSIAALIENSDYLYYDSTAKEFYYSNWYPAMAEVFTVTILAQDNVGGVGLAKLTGSLAFDEQPSDETFNASSYTISYNVSQLESGEPSITFQIYDLVGNVNNSVSIGVNEDNIAPDVPTIIDVLESSNYLYYNGSAFFYTNNKPSMNELFTINFTTDDNFPIGAGLFKAVGSTEFGGETPEDLIYMNSYQLSYIVTGGESAGPDDLINITVIDRVANVNFKVIDSFLDNLAPSGSISSINEGNSPFIHTADLDKIWYSTQTGLMSQSVSVSVSASDTGLNSAGVNVIEFPQIDDDEAINLTLGTPKIYTFTSTYTTNKTVFIIIFDNVGNSFPIGLQVIQDHKSPNIQFSDVTDPVYDPTGTELDEFGNWYDQQKLLNGNFSIFSTPGDSLSGIMTVNGTWDSTGGEFHTFDFGPSGDGNVTSLNLDSDGVIIVTLTVYDNVNNTAQTSITIRFDNTSPEPNTVDSTILHQNGPTFILSGGTNDSFGSGIQNITLFDYTGNHFPQLISSGFDAWSLVNTSSFASGLIGENISVNVTIFDNVHNSYSYNATITYHTFKLIGFTTTIPPHVEIDDPGTWNISFEFEYDGVSITSVTDVIDRPVILTQFQVFIDGIALTLNSLDWDATDLSLNVSLPDSGSAQVPSIGQIYSVQVSWMIDDVPVSIQVDTSYTEPNVVTFHDLEIYYVSDDLEIIETDNPDLSLMNVTLHLEEDYSPYSADLSVNNMNLTVDSVQALYLDSENLGSGNHKLTFQLPAGLSTGLKDIEFTWRRGLGGYFYVVESNVSTGGVVTYHDIVISASIPASMQLFEIDGDFFFDVSYSVTESNGTQFLDNTSAALQALVIRGQDLTARIDFASFIDYINGNYFFNFDLFANDTTSAWIDDQPVRFGIQTLSGLIEWGEVTITGHDLQMVLESIFTWPVGLDFFDPDERTTFEINITVTDNNGTGSSPVTDLNFTSNFVQIYFENIQPEVINQNATIDIILEWGDIDRPQGKYYIRFNLEAQDATQLGIGQMMLNLTINDTNGHLVMSSSKAHNIDLEGKDFVLLLGLEWIYIPNFNGTLSSGNFTFGYGSTNATFGYTFRVSINSTIMIKYRIYALENPGQVSVDWQNIYWETPWNITQQLQGPLNSTSYATLNVSSNQVYRQLYFIAYVEGNREKQLSLSPWRFYLEWDKIEAGTSDVDDDATDLNNTVLNVDGSYTLTYNAQFNRSGLNAAGSIFDVGIILSQYNGLTWVEFNQTSFKHLDGSGNLSPIFFSNGTIIVGQLNVIDIPSAPNYADGRIDFQFQFSEVIKVTITLSATEEAKTSGRDYRYYPSYPPYPSEVFSYVNETSATLFQETIIWTKFKVQMYAADDRIPMLTGATIFVSAHYAHDPSFDLSGVRVYILDNNLLVELPSSTQWLNNEVNFTNLISLGVVEKVTYNITWFDDPNFGISVFENTTTGTSNVKVDIIWDQIIFEIGFAKPWSSSIRFNVNESAFVEIKAYYDYDETPFNGTIYLQHTTFSDTSTLFMGVREWNESVTVPIPPQYETGPGNTLFLINGVISDKYGLNGTQEGQGYRVLSDLGSRWLILRWDRVIIHFAPDKDAYNPGDPLNVTLNIFYESDGKPLNSSHFEYTLFKDGQEFSPANRSLFFFTDNETHTIVHTYHIEWSHDFITNLKGAYSSGVVKEPKAYITIEWKDILPPILLEHYLIDFGNGTVGFYVLTTDNIPGKYFGSGLESVTAQLTLPGETPGDIVQLDLQDNTSYGISFYNYTTTDSDVPRNHFKYNDWIIYEITLTDIQGNSQSKTFSQYLASDSAAPWVDPFDLVKVKFSPHQDGNLTILVNASDIWSGLAGAEIIFKNPETGNWSEFYEMSNLTMGIEDTIYEDEYSFSTLFDVGDIIDYEIRIFDNVGNIKLIEGTIDVIDESGPQLVSGNFKYSGFGAFSINITIADNGSTITSAVLRYTLDNDIGLINLTEALVGGGGSSLQNTNFRYEKVFIGKFTLPTDLISLESKTVGFSLILTDSEGNERTISNNTLMSFLTFKGFELDVDGFELSSNVIEILPLVLVVIFGLLLGLAFLAVRQFRTVGGFDKKKVLEDLVKISDTEVWEENDNVSVGLVASFFDQVKGPVPIIFFPDRLRSSEAMLATLADRSFSTLGFVPKPEEDKHATFRFQVAGEKCTVFGFAFAFDNPEARGGQENLSLSFIVRPPWGNLENINRFLNELLDQLRRIRELMKEQTDVKVVQREMQNTRNFLTRAMLTFRKKYRKEFIE